MSNRLDSLQVLRGFACLIVVFHHVFRSLTIFHSPTQDSILIPSAYLIQLGSIGVDIFFIISGFIMVWISDPYINREKTISDFLLHRIIRIWPVYAIVTSLQCLFLIKEALLGGYRPFDLHLNRLLSLFFIPSFNERGLLQPILGVGWSLNYEVYFYLLFALSLFIARRFIVPVLLGMIVATLFVSNLFPVGPFKTFFSNPIILEFIFGAAIAVVYKKFQFNLNNYSTLFASLTVISFYAFYSLDLPIDFRFFSYGIPAIFIFLTFLALHKIQWPEIFIKLGDASYSIYLIHILVIYQITDRVEFFGELFSSKLASFITSIIAISVAVFLGFLFYKLVEVPILNYLRSQMTPRQT